MKQNLTSTPSPASSSHCLDYNHSQDSCQEFSLVTSKNHKRYNSISIFNNCIVYTPEKTSFPHKFKQTSRRGSITSFSNRSRFRLFTLLAKITNIKDIQPLFLTLTYHHNYNNLQNSHKKDLHQFLDEVRKKYPELSYIWRLEYQKRGAPHFHFMLFPGENMIDIDTTEYVAFFNSVWHRISDPTSKAHAKYGCKLVCITSYCKACAYMSKYIAKLPPSFQYFVEGRHWGASNNLPLLRYCEFYYTHKEAKIIIELLRKWLYKQGKIRYSSAEYFNIYRPQTVFIDKKSFFNIEEDYTDEIKLLSLQALFP